MHVITEVLKDLYIFAVRYRFGFATTASSTIDTKTFSPFVVAPLYEQTKKEEQKVEPYKDVGYASIPDTFLHVLPTRTFDGVIERLAYGESFTIVSTQGKWYNVDHNGIVGWIQFDDVARSSAALNPKFTIGSTYGADHKSTIQLRTRIDDAFHAASLELPLQDVEYTSYKLARKKQIIDWPTTRPRVAGTWQRLLKGVSGIHLGITPKNGTVMEYINANNTGHVTYVESVFPDSTIVISEIGYPSEGVYSERTLTKDEWVELRPIFIEVA